MFRVSLKKLRGDVSGNVAIVFAVCILPLIAAAGIALDFIRAEADRATLQSAVDAAVLAGVWKAPGIERDIYAAAFAEAEFTGLLASENINVAFQTNADGSYTGTARAEMPAALLPAIGISSIPVVATATAVPMARRNNVCILLMDPAAPQSLLVNGGAAVSSPECEIHVHSRANPAAIVNGGTVLDVKRICVAGSHVIVNGGAKPPLETDCAVANDPFAGELPAPDSLACTVSNKVYDPSGGERVLNPGVYCGWTIFNGTQKIRFNPGTYVIKNGGMIINGNSEVKGEGVTFYLADQQATLTLNGNLELSLKAPVSGPLQGVLMYEPNGLPKSPLVFNGSVRTHFEGLLYLPSRNVTFNATSNVDSERLTMVFNTLTLNAAQWSFSSAERAIPGGEGDVTGSVRLVR